MRREWKEKRMAAMFLLRVDSFTEEARRSRGHVLLPSCRLQSIWPGLTKWGESTEGSPLSTSVTREHAREKARQSCEKQAMLFPARFRCWVSRWKSRISNHSKTHAGFLLASTHIHHCTVMLVKYACFSPGGRIKPEQSDDPETAGHSRWTLVDSKEPDTGFNQLKSVKQCSLIVHNAPGSCFTLLTLS